MKKTSRRSFGKQLTGALVSLPAMATVLEGQQKQKPQEQKKADTQTKIFREHNTPPPMFFMPGSLIVEAATAKNDWNNFQTTQNRRIWSVIPTPYPDGTQPTNIYIAHVKLLDGSGEMFYHLDNETTADRETPIQITSLVHKNGSLFGDCILSPSGNHFEINVPNDKKIKQKNNDPSTNPGLRQRARFMHDNDDEAFQFKSLRIDKGNNGTLFFEPDLPRFPGYSDLKVLIWWANI